MDNLLALLSSPTLTGNTTGTVGAGEVNGTLGAGDKGASFEKFLEDSRQAIAEKKDIILDELSAEQLAQLQQILGQQTQTFPLPLQVAIDANGKEMLTTQAPPPSKELEQFLHDMAGATKDKILEAINLASNQQKLSLEQQNFIDQIKAILQKEAVAQDISIKATTDGQAASNTQATTGMAHLAAKPTESVFNPKMGHEKTQNVHQVTSNLVAEKPSDGQTQAVTATGEMTDAKNSLSFSELSLNQGQARSFNNDSSSLFHQMFSTTLSGTELASQASVRVITLPSGQMVYDDQVLQQFNNQLRFHNIGEQSQINIRLNPAELGELKIDLAIKDGNIRVNVLAHSQQAQQILERNMPKLREILENQGLSIESLAVVNAPENIEQSPDFQGYLAQNKSNNEHFSSPKKSASQHITPVNEEEILEQIISPDHGTNGLNIVI